MYQGFFQTLQGKEGWSKTLSALIINFACWNVRGIKSPSKQKEVRYLILRFKLGCVALVEAKAKEEDLVRIARNCALNRD